MGAFTGAAGKIIVDLSACDIDEAMGWLEVHGPHFGRVKLGHSHWRSTSRESLLALARRWAIFLDLGLEGTATLVAGEVAEIAAYGVAWASILCAQDKQVLNDAGMSCRGERLRLIGTGATSEAMVRSAIDARLMGLICRPEQATSLRGWGGESLTVVINSSSSQSHPVADLAVISPSSALATLVGSQQNTPA